MDSGGSRQAKKQNKATKEKKDVGNFKEGEREVRAAAEKAEATFFVYLILLYAVPGMFMSRWTAAGVKRTLNIKR
jgi:hypothetical protein